MLAADLIMASRSLSDARLASHVRKHNEGNTEIDTHHCIHCKFATQSVASKASRTNVEKQVQARRLGPGPAGLMYSLFNCRPEGRARDRQTSKMSNGFDKVPLPNLP